LFLPAAYGVVIELHVKNATGLLGYGIVKKSSKQELEVVMPNNLFTPFEPNYL